MQNRVKAIRVDFSLRREVFFVVVGTIVGATRKMQRVLIPLSIIIVLSFLMFPNPVLLAHTFSENENALFLTMINKIKAETQLVAHDFSNNTEQAQDHAKAAEELFTQKDPLVNTTWTAEISERNPRVTADLLHNLNDLKTSVASSPSNSDSGLVQSKVTNIGNLLDEAVSVRISKNLLDTPKTQALVLANLGNEIYNNYGAALGLLSASTSTVSNSVTNAMNQSPATIKNLTAYQTAESLAGVARQVFDENLKPIVLANTTNPNSIANYLATHYILAEQRYLDQLKNGINNKLSFVNVTELIHGKLHPTLIRAYNLRL
jgi:hypothetical protein